jgi:hypothetical protein
MMYDELTISARSVSEFAQQAAVRIMVDSSNGGRSSAKPWGIVFILPNGNEIAGDRPYYREVKLSQVLVRGSTIFSPVDAVVGVSRQHTIHLIQALIKSDLMTVRACRALR